MMNTSQKLIALLSGAALLSVSSLAAQTATTDPVGYVNLSVGANADLKVGVPMAQSPAYTGVVDTVINGVVTVSSTVPDVTTAAHYLWVSSGALNGQWFVITGYTASSLTVAEDLANAGLVATDSFRVVPFWTLGSLFPNGGGLPTTDNPSIVNSFIFLNDVTATGTNLSASGGTYFPFDNGSFSGWLDASNPSAFVDDDIIISPASYVTLRNVTESAETVTITGNVPVYTVSNQIVSRAAGAQDNQVFLPYPADTLIGNLGLVAAGAISSTDNPNVVEDFLLVYSQGAAGLNPSATAAYFHFDNGSVSGWLDASNPSAFVDDSVTIPASSALIIRRAASSDTMVEWAAPLPYTL
jgi:uncharacterized protein (TIGR02597 family)